MRRGSCWTAPPASDRAVRARNPRGVIRAHRRRGRPAAVAPCTTVRAMYPGEHAKARPDQPAFVMATSGEVVTMGDYEARCNRLAHLYRAAGLSRTDHVAFFMENNPRMLEAEGAAERSGLYYTCINSYLSAEEVAYIVNDCEAQVLIASAAKRTVASDVVADSPNVRRFLMVDDVAPGFE